MGISNGDLLFQFNADPDASEQTTIPPFSNNCVDLIGSKLTLMTITLLIVYVYQIILAYENNITDQSMPRKLMKSMFYIPLSIYHLVVFMVSTCIMCYVLRSYLNTHTNNIVRATTTVEATNPEVVLPPVGINNDINNYNVARRERNYGDERRDVSHHIIIQIEE